jgi:tetratricopeptide (TPR) repeat protein
LSTHSAFTANYDRHVRRWLVLAGIVIVISSIAGYCVGTRHTSRDTRVDRAFVLAQRGENDKALQILTDYLAGHRDDADATAIAFLATWWQGGSLDELEKRLGQLELRPAQRALVQGITLITHRRDAEAIAFFQNAAKDTPNAVEIEYGLGEAMWHGGQLDAGATTLEHAFARDPRWEMALHHVIEYRLSRGEAGVLAPVVEKLRGLDPAAAAALDCQLAVGNRDYARAAELARAELARTDDRIPEVYLCLAQAQALAGDYTGGAATAKIAFDLWPVETADRGAFAQYAEFLLYADKLDDYLALTRGRQSSQRALALLLRRDGADVDVPQPEWPAKRMPPLGAATWMLQQHVRGKMVATKYPEPEVDAWGRALDAEAKGDRDAAIAALREALVVPAKGDIRMLVAHRLARLLHDSGDAAGAAAACEEVIRPRFYVDYRALLLPDCIAWTKR